VLMSVEVRDRDSSGLNLANLCRGFGLDFIAVDPSSDRSRSERLESIPKACRRSSGRERRELLGLKNRFAVDEHNVTPNAQPWRVLGEFRSLEECGTVRHQRGRGHNAAGMRFEDRSVHAGGETEVIRVDDQPAHEVSLAAAKLGSVGGNGFRAKAPAGSEMLSLTAFSGLGYTRESAVRDGCPSKSSSDRRDGVVAHRREGRLAQLVRAPALQAGGRRFESCTAHHIQIAAILR
jgi:hypothetical protein